MKRSFDTAQLHAGQQTSDPATRARAVPIYATSSFTFDSAEHAEGLFGGQVQGNQYGRMHNPTAESFARRLAVLEGGVSAVPLSSGQAATTATLLALTRPESHVVMSHELFGGTFAVAGKLLEHWGCLTSRVAPTSEAIADAIRPETVAVWVETIANPSGTVADIPAIAAACKSAEVPFVVDNTFGCGGYLCRPLELGADIVVHSATKWIGGHGTFVGGAVVDGGSYRWSNGRFPAFTTPDARGRSYVERGGEAALATRVHDLGLFTMGMSLSPFAAFLGLQGLETLSLRAQRSCDSALELAQWLERQPMVARVLYPGIASHPSHGTAKRVLRHGFGGVLSFEMTEVGAARRFVERVQLASHLANIGDAKTVVINPWSTTHSGLRESERRLAGATPEMVRVSVGLEDIDDIVSDFAQALEA